MSLIRSVEWLWRYVLLHSQLHVYVHHRAII